VNYIQLVRMYTPAMDETTWRWGDVLESIKI